jgi:hypothetical protein
VREARRMKRDNERRSREYMVREDTLAAGRMV